MYYVIAFVIIVIFFMIIVRGASQDDIEDPIISDKQLDLNPFLKQVQTYFFTDNTFDFEKFSDYVMCIRDDMSLTEYAEMVLELDMLTKVSSQLKDRVFAIIIYDEKLQEFSYKNFEEMRNNLREGKYRGTYQELAYILITTLLYLKHKTQMIKKN